MHCINHLQFGIIIVTNDTQSHRTFAIKLLGIGGRNVARIIEGKPGRSKGEREIREALRHGLDDDYVVFHNLYWHRDDLTWREDTEKHPHQMRKETDFVIFHPDKGILVIEVKGGSNLVVQGPTSFAYAMNKGQALELFDPYVQAQGNLDYLMAFLRAFPAILPEAAKAPVISAVWFPRLSRTSPLRISLQSPFKERTLTSEDMPRRFNTGEHAPSRYDYSPVAPAIEAIFGQATPPAQPGVIPPHEIQRIIDTEPEPAARHHPFRVCG
jgi:hypothetical protein